MMNPRRRLLRGVLFSFFLVTLVSTARDAFAQTDATDIKAAFLYKFALFVEWPDGTFKNASTPLVIGVLDSRDKMTRTLEEVVRGKNINGRPIEVRRLSRTDNPKEVQILFFGASEADRLSNVRSQLGNSPVLTIGESSRFAVNGGILNFINDGDNVRFEVNPEGAHRAKLTVSSQIMRLGKIVKERN